MEEEKRDHEAKMKKMESEMEQVFEMKVREKKQKLKDSEADASIYVVGCHLPNHVLKKERILACLCVCHCLCVCGLRKNGHILTLQHGFPSAPQHNVNIMHHGVACYACILHTVLF